MAIKIVWEADVKGAIQAAGQLARKNIELEQKIQALTGSSKKSSLAYTRGMKANFKSTEEARRGLSSLEKDQRRLQAELVKAQKKKEVAANRARAELVKGQKEEAAANRARADSAKRTAAAQRKAAVGVAAIRDKLAKKQAAVETTLAAARQKHVKKQQAEETRLLAIRKRLYEETRTPRERYAAKMRELNALVKRGAIDQQVYRRAAKQAAEAATSSGDKQLVTGRAVLGQLSAIAGALGVTGGIAGGIALMRQGFENSLELMREITNEASKASGEIVAFAALQEGGKKAERVTVARQMALQYGITDRGEAFDTLQAMQSITGSWEKGLEATKTIFAATQVGIPIQLGRELETLGISQKMEPGVMLRYAYAAGQASGRTPQALAKAAPAMKTFGDKAFGMAFAGTMAGGFPEQQLATYTRRGGMALADTSSMMETFERLGVGEGATQQQRLEALAKAGIDTMVKLEKAGLTEIREMEALATAVPLLSEIKQSKERIIERAKPGLLVKERAAVEQELPVTRITRGLKVGATMYADLKAFGEKAEEETAKKLDQVVRGLAFQRLGLEQMGPFRTYQEEQVEDVGTVPVSTARETFRGAIGSGMQAAWEAVKHPTSIISQETYWEKMDRVKGAEGQVRQEIGATAPEGLRRDIRALGDKLDTLTDAVRGQGSDTVHATESQTDRLEGAVREQGQAQPETRVIEAPAVLEAL